MSWDDGEHNVWEDIEYDEWYNYAMHCRRRDAISFLLESKMKYREPRQWKVRPIFKARRNQGAYMNLVQEMRITDRAKYYNYFRMTPEVFDTLLSIVGPLLQKNTNYRDDNVSPGERLALTLRYLASGDSMMSISYAFRIAESTVSKIIRETCLAIWDSLNKTYLPYPTKDDFKLIAEEFERLWNMPHCIGALDGKHVAVQAFSHCGSAYYNYKNFHSIVLLASCDANYNFILVSVGAEGRNSDGGVFRNSNLGQAVTNGILQFPDAEPLSDERPCSVSYFMVGDEAFPLSNRLMRPYPGRKTGLLSMEKQIFNYRLSRARRCIENAFGIMAGRFRIFRKPILASEQTANSIVLACVILHNYLKSFDDQLLDDEYKYVAPGFADEQDPEGNVVPGLWRTNRNCFNDIDNVVNETVCNRNHSAMETRQILTSYFMQEGAVPWQQESVLFGCH